MNMVVICTRRQEVNDSLALFFCLVTKYGSEMMMIKGKHNVLRLY